MFQQVPHYKRLYESLRKQIENGTFREGELLPSENDLCKVHGVTRPTVRHALDSLVNDGFIRKQQGRGSIVNELPKGIGILSIAGTTTALGSSNVKTRLLVKPELHPWQDDFVFKLNDAEKTAGAIYMERLRLLKDQPVFYDINYLPNIALPRFTSRKLENKSLFDVLREQYQIEVKGGEQRLRAIPANSKVADLLKLTPGDPVLHLERKIATNREGFFIYSSIYCNTEVNAIYGTF